MSSWHDHLEARTDDLDLFATGAPASGGLHGVAGCHPRAAGLR
jgi:hypothetical protein